MITSSVMNRPIERRTVAAEAAEILRRRILAGELRSGQPIRQEQIAQELGVSQMPVREALSRLAAEGAVEIRSKRRIIVPPMTDGRFADLLPCRELLEPAAYEAHRIALGVPRGGLDFIYGDAFPHEADVDQLHGVDFAKGCFVGQEVV